MGVLYFVLCLPCLGVADPFKLSVGADIEERYNDNVFFTADDTEDDFITRYKPWVRGGWEKEVLEFSIGGSAAFYDYSNKDELDAVDQSYDGSLTNRWSSRFSTNLSASYLEDERRERELSETGLLFNDDDRKRQTYGISGQFSISELSALSFSCSYLVEDFDDDLTYDLKGHTVQWILSRRLAFISGRLNGSLALAGSSYAYDRQYATTDSLFGTIRLGVDDEQSIEYYSMRLGAEYDRTERLKFNMDLGARFTRNERTLFLDYASNALFPDNSRKDEDESWGYVATLKTIYSGEKWEVSLLASHDLVPASGRSGITERTTLRLGGKGSIVSQWHYHWAARGYLNSSDNSGVTSNEDELSLLLWAGCRYAFNRSWSLGVYWQTYWIDDRENDVDRTQNTVSLGLNWNWPIFE
jgi:hypothetical protein